MNRINSEMVNLNISLMRLSGIRVTKKQHMFSADAFFIVIVNLLLIESLNIKLTNTEGQMCVSIILNQEI